VKASNLTANLLPSTNEFEQGLIRKVCVPLWDATHKLSLSYTLLTTTRRQYRRTFNNVTNAPHKVSRLQKCKFPSQTRI